MRRHLVITLSLLFVAAGATAAGVASAGASTAAKPHITVKVLSGNKCKPAASFCFKPAMATISPGTHVTFKNMTIASHTVSPCTAASCSGVTAGTGTTKGFGGSLVGTGATYKFVFKGAGTYNYYCQVHGYLLMHGTITVS